MRHVQQASMRPHRCSVFPNINGQNARGGFLDTGQDARADDHVYVSLVAVEEMARMIGWQHSSVSAPLEAKLKARDARIVELEGLLAEAEHFKDAAEYTMARFGAKVQSKPGRKPKVPA